MATMPIAVPGKEPGEVLIPALGRSFKQIELHEDDVFDSVESGTGSITAGSEYILFRDIANKNEQHTSLNTSRRLSAGDEAAVFRVGVHPRGAQGNTVPAFTDLKKVLENFSLLVKFNKRVITEGPLIKYQSGYGIAGHSDETGVNAVSVGVPSIAAAPTLFVPQQLKDDDDLIGKIKSPDAQWLTSYTAPVLGGRVVLTTFLHAVLKAPLGK